MAYTDHIVVDGVQYDLRDKEAVSFAQEQTLTETQQEQARENIGAGSEADVVDLKSKTDYIKDRVGGTYSITDFGTWAAGGLTRGAFDSATYYRLSTMAPVYLPDGLKFTVAAGRRAVVHTVTSDGTFISDSGWITGGTTYTIPAETYVMMMLSPTSSTSAAELEYHATKAEYASFATYSIASIFIMTQYADAHMAAQKYITTGTGYQIKSTLQANGNPYYSDAFSADLYVTDYLLIADLIGMTVIGAESWLNANAYAIAFYDVNQTVIGTAYTPTSETGQMPVDIEINSDLLANYGGAVYCRIAGNVAYGTQIGGQNSTEYPPYNISAYPKIICCGDSVTYGFVVEGTQASPSQIYSGIPAQSYPACMGRIIGNEITTKAQSGITVKQFYETLYPTVTWTDYTMAIFELGLNPGSEGYLSIDDINTPGKSAYIYRQMIAALRTAAPDIVIVLMRSAAHMAGGQAVLEYIANESNCIVINLADATYINLNDTKYHGWFDNNGTPTFDDTHFTRAGYAAKAFDVIKWLGALLPN